MTGKTRTIGKNAAKKETEHKTPIMRGEKNIPNDIPKKPNNPVNVKMENEVESSMKEDPSKDEEAPKTDETSKNESSLMVAEATTPIGEELSVELEASLGIKLGGQSAAFLIRAKAVAKNRERREILG